MSQCFPFALSLLVEFCSSQLSFLGPSAAVLARNDLKLFDSWSVHSFRPLCPFVCTWLLSMCMCLFSPTGQGDSQVQCNTPFCGNVTQKHKDDVSSTADYTKLSKPSKTHHREWLDRVWVIIRSNAVKRDCVNAHSVIRRCISTPLVYGNVKNYSLAFVKFCRWLCGPTHTWVHLHMNWSRCQGNSYVSSLESVYLYFITISHIFPFTLNLHFLCDLCRW